MKTWVKLALAAGGVALLAYLLWPVISGGSRGTSRPRPARSVQRETPPLEPPDFAESLPIPGVDHEPAPNPTASAADALPAGRRVYSFEHAAVPPLPGQLRAYERFFSSGVLIDPQRELILWGHHENRLVPIASMTKLMTLYVALARLPEDAALTLDQPITVSDAAASMGGTQVWLAPGETFTLHKLLEAMMVASANDAAYAIGEALSATGRIEPFIVEMNRQARFLGMRRARFYNSHGLPGATADEDNVATALDMAVLALELQHVPGAREYCRTERATFRPDTQQALVMRNHNRLLGSCRGVDGMKTGFIRRAGFCLTATCRRNGVLLIAVVTGFDTKEHRNDFVCELFDWGYDVRRPRPAPETAGP